MAFATVLAGANLAEDLVQEAVIATFTKSRNFESVDHAERYVRRAIATRYVDVVRKNRSRVSRELRTAPRDVIPGPELNDPLSNAVVVALASLSPQVRACVALRYLEDMSIRSTASILGLSEGTVKRYVSDGLRHLNERLGTQESVDTFDTVDVTGVASRREGTA